MEKPYLTIDQIIAIAELNELNRIIVFGVSGVHEFHTLVLAGPNGPITVVANKEM